MHLSFSVVIPTLNEAANLAELLPQLAAQSRPPLEVLVADAGSPDGTAEVAAEHGARVVPGGRPGLGRNNGARQAQGDWLFFLDADSRLPENRFAERVLEDLDRQSVQAAVCDCAPYYRPGDKGFDRPGLRRWDRFMMRTQSRGQRFWLRRGFPVGTCQFLATRREAFWRLGGFDSRVEPFEDSEYLLRVHRALPPAQGRPSSVGVLAPGLSVYVSMRRFDAKGHYFFPLRLSLQSVLLRYLLRRELPMPSYWEVNDRGFGPRARGGGRAG